MKNYFLPAILSAILLVACKERKKEDQVSSISIVSIIKGQINDLDTSLYQITKIELSENFSDTTVISRDKIKPYTAVFLSLPDITENKYRDKYSEERQLDMDQQTLSITSTNTTQNEEIQKQMVIVGLSDISNGKVQSIYIDRYISSSDSTIEQKLFWQIDKGFSITNIIQKENQPEKIHRTKIEWQ